MTKIIYGTGKYGRLLYDFCIDNDLFIDYFCQTERPDRGELFGVPILSIDDIMRLDGDISILIAIKNDDDALLVVNQIIKVRKERIRVFKCGSFIKENLEYRKGITNQTGLLCCNICCNCSDVFTAAGIEQELFRKYHIIGAGYRENNICPSCGASDRERWLYYVINKYTDIVNTNGKVLHFAPEKSVVDLLIRNKRIDYYTGDIVPGKAMHVIDITNIHFEDSTFDYVISNHVMEHISDESKAISEIKRVLKRNGKWIFSFPICTDIDTYEDKSIVTDEDRLKMYGQEDHVRLYGRDYKERFMQYGLCINSFTPKDLLPKDEIIRFGFIEDDVINVATKS